MEMGEDAKPQAQVSIFSPDELGKFTDNYSESNFLCVTKFSKLYRGKILDGSEQTTETRAVTVKIFDDSKLKSAFPGDKLSRFKDEIYLLRHPVIEGHQNLPKLIGYCPECLGVVYDINPRSTLDKLIPQDDFTWLQRIKVGLQFASLLAFFHNSNPPNLVRNVEAAHLMVDQDNNPILFEFGMLVGGLFDDATDLPNRKLIGACDCRSWDSYTVGGLHITRDITDVFSYGVLLLNLIAKRIFYICWQGPLEVQWAKKDSKGKMSWLELVRFAFNGPDIFKEDPTFDAYDGQKVVHLVMSCIDRFPRDRPTTKEILDSLLALHVVQDNELWEAGKCKVVEFLPSQFRLITGELGKENFLGDTQSGKLYRVLLHGADSREARVVTVKIWNDPMDGFANKFSNFTDEVCFLQHPSVSGHQKNLAKPFGYSCKCECLGIIYDLNTRDTLLNLILQDNFSWLQRIKVALQFARLLVFLHNYNPPFIVGNISAAHIAVDQEYNPVLFDFGMLIGGFFANTRDIPNGKLPGAPGCVDLHFLTTGGWSIMHDVFSYGVLLLSLIAKSVFDISWPKTSVVTWAKKDSEDKISWSALDRNVFNAHGIFKEDPDYDVYDGQKLMKLAMSCIELLPKDRPTMKEIFESLQALHIVQLNGMVDAGNSEVLECLPHQMREFTGEFSKKNYLGNTQFGKLYRGVISHGGNSREARVVTVKMWDDSVCGFTNPEDKLHRLIDEVCLLQHPIVKNNKQNLAKPILYSRKHECLGIVYDLNPLDILNNLILQDNFTWFQRIKVAVQLARVLVFLHSYNPPFIIRNISAAHIMVDQDCNPVLIDFGMMVGGIFGNTRDIPNGNLFGAPGYEDLNYLTDGGWSTARDVFSYGVLLLSLITKKVSDSSRPETSIVFWAKYNYKGQMSWFEIEKNVSHVDKIFKEDPDYDVCDACKLMRLAMHCIEFHPARRPTMNETLESLQALLVVQHKGMIEGLNSKVLQWLPQQLREITAGSVYQNFLGDTQFGKLYRGKIHGAHAVTVKMWDNWDRDMDMWSRLTDELYLLQHPSVNGHQQGLAKPIGYCRESECLGTVYSLNPKDTLDKLILQGNFTWLQRIKVALQFAHLLAFLHNYNPPFIVRNISAAHIVVDKDDNPVLLDLGMLVGGFFGSARDFPDSKFNGVIGYTDPHFITYGRWSVESDVFSFGVVLQSLITRTVFDITKPKTCLKPWITGAARDKVIITQADIEPKVASVHGIFKDDSAYDCDDAVEITKLAMSCMDVHPMKRPRMKQTFERLQALHVVKFHSKELGI